VCLEYKPRDEHDENEDDMEEEEDDDDYNDENEEDDEDDFSSERRARARASRCLIVNEAQDQIDSLLSADTKQSIGFTGTNPNLSVTNDTGGGLFWLFIVGLFCYICIFYYLYVDSLTHTFGWSAFLCRIRFYDTLVIFFK
jgi:hypothetical protein